MTWILFKCPRQPIFDRKGKISAALRRIIYARDERKATYGGDYLEPDLGHLTVLERHKRDNLLLIRIDKTLVNPSIRVVPWIQARTKKGWKTIAVMEIRPGMFNSATLTQEEAEATGLIFKPAEDNEATLEG